MEHALKQAAAAPGKDKELKLDFIVKLISNLLVFDCCCRFGRGGSLIFRLKYAWRRPGEYYFD